MIYQMLVRLFGNTCRTNKPWGTIEENGIGRFVDITDTALQAIRDLGVTHVWYTGILHHALIRDYSAFGIPNDDPSIVKGRAGSPYAVKDYYNVNPDLCIDPGNGIAEFLKLIDRTHQVGMKVIMDIIPNHVSRAYHGIHNPPGVVDFGATDDRSVSYRKDNNFYYIPGEPFQIPEWKNGYQPLGGNPAYTDYQAFQECPAKWTGNGSRSSRPDMNDWYETVKINFGLTPEGTKDYDALPESYRNRSYRDHFDFWKTKDVPDSWKKFNQIVTYWLDFGIDGFRFDMAEMIPVEFWSYLNSTIKSINPDCILIAEVYNPSLYRDYIQMGKMDYLYDKVDFYDGLKHIMKGYGWSDHLIVVQNQLADIEQHMLHFLENHDEQRLASPDFLGNPKIAKPGLVVSATISTAPLMIYFGQEVGEPGAEHAGFGRPSRTTIFDYIGVPHHQRWMNDGKFDGGGLSEEEDQLRQYYSKVLNFAEASAALQGDYQEIHFYNKDNTEQYDHRVLSYVRWSDDEIVIIAVNFDSEKQYEFDLKIPHALILGWNLSANQYSLREVLSNQDGFILCIDKGLGVIDMKLKPLESVILHLERP